MGSMDICRFGRIRGSEGRIGWRDNILKLSTDCTASTHGLALNREKTWTYDVCGP